MGIIVKQLIFNTMLENNNKIVGNNQQTESEAKLVSNTLNPESMEDKDTHKKELEGNNMEINNLKSNTMKISLEKLIDMFNLSDTIKSLHEELKKAKEKLAQAKENRQKSALRKVAQAKKALKEELKKHPLPLPVEEWMPAETEDGDYLIKRFFKTIYIVAAPAFINLATKDKFTMETINDKLFERDFPKYLTKADLFSKENITLTSLNGVPVEKELLNDAYIMIGNHKEQRMMQAIYWENEEALVEDKPLTIISNIQIKEFETIQKCAQYMGTNTALDKTLKGCEKAVIASFATQHELLQKVQQVSIDLKIPVSTTMKYYTLGKIFTPVQWSRSTSGILPKAIQYNLQIGEHIISKLQELGLEKEIGKRYFIDAFVKLTTVKSPTTKESIGVNNALSMLDTLTEEEVEYIQGLDGDKVFDILTFLSNKFERSIAKQ